MRATAVRKEPAHEQVVLVTGGAGFVGRRVVRRLIDTGYSRVFVARRRDYDLRREVECMRLIADVRPQIVVHLAAVVGGIGANREHPGGFFFDNLMMGANLMEASRLGDVGKFVAIGTVCAYPKHTPVPFREDALWDGYPEETNAPYGLAKKMLLVQGQAYAAEYGFNSIYLLPTNLYGPGDNFDPTSSHVIPALIRRCLEAVAADAPELVVWGDGTASREFLYVDDAAEAIVLAMERYDAPAPVNLGAGREITIKALVEIIARQTGFRGDIVWDTSKPNGQPRRCLDTTRAQELFGFRAATAFDEGLRRTIDWYRSVNGQPVVAAPEATGGWVKVPARASTPLQI
jgi:GDP-L-fucose synthase